MSNPFRRLLHRPFFIRLLHWEYWGFGTVYGLIYPVFAALMVRERFRFFGSAANPTIRNGGFLMESKNDIHALLPEGCAPATLFFKAGIAPMEVLETVRRAEMEFPLMIKPDTGMRGLAVRKMNGAADLIAFVPCYTVDFLVQDFVPFEQEAGIFYYRLPGSESGRISGIVTKEFLTVTGDGQSTLEELLRRDKRYLLQIPSLVKEYGPMMSQVPGAGEKRLLVPYGNHARGAKFIDDTHRTDDALLQVVDNFCRNVPGFFYGRLDIRYHSWEDLRAGKYFSVVELNGAGSEPTHMYDPRHSLFFAWKEIIRHWILLWRISRMNHRLGHRYMSLREMAAMFRANRAHESRLLEVHHALLEARPEELPVA